MKPPDERATGAGAGEDIGDISQDLKADDQYKHDPMNGFLGAGIAKVHWNIPVQANLYAAAILSEPSGGQLAYRGCEDTFEDQRHVIISNGM